MPPLSRCATLTIAFTISQDAARVSSPGEILPKVCSHIYDKGIRGGDNRVMRRSQRNRQSPILRFDFAQHQKDHVLRSPLAGRGREVKLIVVYKRRKATLPLVTQQADHEDTGDVRQIRSSYLRSNKLQLAKLQGSKTRVDVIGGQARSHQRTPTKSDKSKRHWKKTTKEALVAVEGEESVHNEKRSQRGECPVGCPAFHNREVRRITERKEEKEE
jgi:hypothetical protein